MDAQKIMEILADTAYVRTGGSGEELRCAEYLAGQAQALCGKAPRLEAFPVEMADIQQAVLTVDGVQVPCKGYLCAGSGTVEGPLYYLTGADPWSLEQCRGKIVLFDGYLGYWKYQDMLSHGALGFISYSGNANYGDHDIDQRELRSYVSNGVTIPGVNINAKDAIALVERGARQAKIVLDQTQYTGQSHNVVLDLPGTVPQTIVFTAHYDSTSLSQGAYDNMSGSIGLLAIAEHFGKVPHRYGLRFVWCGSEERGLLGSKAYCRDHAEELKDVVLNINLDMIGSIMGKFIAVGTCEEAMISYIRYVACEEGFGMEARQGVYSSDSTPFADSGVPAVSFARIAPGDTATIHNRYDTAAVMSGGQMERDIAFLIGFAERMACAQQCPVSREIPDAMKEKLDIYLNRKREQK